MWKKNVKRETRKRKEGKEGKVSERMGKES